MIRIIYIDLDGVLANFEKLVFERCGYLDFKDSNKDWRNDIFYDKTFFIDIEPFWYTPHLINKCKEVCNDVQILSATGITNPEETERQKRIWCNNHLYPIISEDKVQIVKNSEDKSLFAWPGDESIVLIDDNLIKSILPFRESGGIGIHHISPSETFKQINELPRNA